MNKLKIIVLGSGTCVPSVKRSSCSILCDTGQAKVLFDLGPGTMARLIQAGVEIFAITHIFISHFHPDHSAELVPFLFTTKYFGSTRRKVPLTVVMGPGGEHFYNMLKMPYGNWVELDEEAMVIREMGVNGINRIDFADFSVQAVQPVHNPESLSYRISNRDGVSLVYSGDTDYSLNLIELAVDADLFVCEAATPDALKVNGHSSPSIAGAMAARAGVKTLMLTHFYPECDQVDIAAECRKTYNGPLILAQDLMQLSLP